MLFRMKSRLRRGCLAYTYISTGIPTTFIRSNQLIGPQVNEDTQMSRLSKNFNFFVLSFQWLLGSSDILVLVTTNFLSMTTSMKKSTVPAFFLAYV